MTPTDDKDGAATPDLDGTAHNARGSPVAGGSTATFHPDHDTQPKGATPESVPASVSVPGYEIVRVIGRGGMGVVYEARHLALKRTVALKMVLAGGHAGPRELARFRIEAEAVARLQHPNIVQIHEVGEVEGHPYFALEYVAGDNLASKLGGKPMPARDAAKLVETLARAMQLAHSRNVVHRDLKPGNIMLTADGTPKITDFGLARQMDSDHGETQTGVVMGTPSYMAPEQASGRAHEAGPAADVYALGAILYACLAGRPPFKGKTTVETLDQVRTQEPAPPSRWQTSAPLDLETICLKCLRKEPERRYASAEALAEDLRRWQTGEPIAARPVGGGERALKWVRRHPARAGLVAAMILLLVSVATFASVLAVREHSYNVDLLREQEDKEKALKQSRLASARLALDRGLILCEQGDVGRGLVALTRALSAAIEAEDADLESAIRFNLAAWYRVLWPLRTVLNGPEGSHVWTAALSPRDAILAMALSNNTVQLCSAAEGDAGRVLHTLPHEGAIAILKFSGDGRLLLTTTERTVRVWDVAIGKLVGSPLVHDARVGSAAISPDGQHVLTGCNDKMARLWDTATGKPIRSPWLHKYAVSLVEFSPDGAQALTVSRDIDGVANLWTIATGERVGAPLFHGTAVTAAAFSPDGTRLLIGTSGGKVHVWQLSTAEAMFTPVPHDGAVLTATFSPDGKLFAVRTLPKTLHLRKADSGLAIASPISHPGPVESVAFSSDSQTLLSGGFGATARFWSTTTGQPAAPPLIHQGAVRTCTFSADGRTLLTVDGTLRLYGRAEGIRRGPFLKHGGEVRTLAFSPDGNRLLTGSLDKMARLWNTVDGTLTFKSEKQRADVQTVAFSPDGKLACTGGADARLWDLTDGPAPRSLPHKQPVYSLVFSHDGKTMLTGATDGARRWDVATGQLRATLPHKGIVHAVALNRDASIALTGSADRTARLWDLSSQPPTAINLDHAGPVETVVFSPDGQTAYTADRRDKSIRLWETATGKLIRTLPGHEGGVKAIAVSHDGRFVLSGGDDKVARLWDAGTGAALGSPMQHQDLVRAVAFSPDARTALTGSYDGIARRWHVPTGLPVGPPFAHGKILALAISPKGDVAATASFDGTAALWNTPPALLGTPEQLALWAQVVTGHELDDSGAVHVPRGSMWQERRIRLVPLFP